MKKALVTGADGFIGSHLTEFLLERGYKVKALAYYNSFNYWGWLEDVPPHPNLEIVTGDVRDQSQCHRLVEDVDLIFHLAALIAIPYSYIAPESYIGTNISGTLNICLAAKRRGNLRTIITSTSEVYGTAKYVPIDERHMLQPQSPYSASKIGADAIAMSFFNAYSLPVSIARPFNTYGPRQSARAIIPSIIIQIANNAKQLSLGDMRPTRDFNYVKDICNGFLQIAECEATIGEIVNIGSKTEISIKDLANRIRELMHSKTEIILEESRLRPLNSEVNRLVCDNSRIVSMTGYSPLFNIEDGLMRTIEWFLQPNNLIKYKSDIYNV